MTDLECMYHRFSHQNIKKSTGTIAQCLGISTKEYEEAVKRGMAEEQEILKNNKANKEIKSEGLSWNDIYYVGGNK